MMEICLNNVTKNFGFNNVLDKLSFEVKTGDKIALVGENGCGKSTILKLITKEELPTSGDVFIKKESRVGYLTQEPIKSLFKLSVREILYNSFGNLNKLKNKMDNYECKMNNLTGDKQINAINKYLKVQEEFIKAGGYEIDAKIDKIVSAFNMERLLDLKYEILSGGEKTLVNLVTLLLSNPDILLLDEPTNHLDIRMLEYLEDYLKNYKGTILIVSHDRYFLDKVVDKIILIENGKTNVFHGNYSYFLIENEKRIEKEFKEYKDQQKKIEAMKKSIKKLREFGKKAYPGGEPFFKRAASIEKRLEKLEKKDKPITNNKIPLKLEVGKRSGKDVIVAKNINISFDNHVLFKDANLELFYKEKVCIVGGNGTGKSTLIKYILKNKDLYISESASISYVSQEFSFDDNSITVLDEAKKYFYAEENILRSALSKFMFNGQEVFKRLSKLSGGEKIRLKLFCIMQENNNLLILDEPTNHIDISAKEVLEEAINNYNGTVLLISHDRYFINKVATRIINIENKKLVSYVGNYDDFKNKLKK